MMEVKLKYNRILNEDFFSNKFSSLEHDVH